MQIYVLHLYLPAQFSEAYIQFMLSAGGLLITAVVICHSQRSETLTHARLQYNILYFNGEFVLNGSLEKKCLIVLSVQL